MRVGRQSEGQLFCGDARAFRYLSVVQDRRDVPGDWSFKHVFLTDRSLTEVKSWGGTWQ